MSIRFLRAHYFVWIALPLAGLLAYLLLGLPHIIWSYEWRDNGTYDPAAPRHYTRCTFIGPYGTFTTYPANGKCSWVLFRKSGEKA